MQIEDDVPHSEKRRLQHCNVTGTGREEKKGKTENDREMDSRKGKKTCRLAIMGGGKNCSNQQGKVEDFCGGLMRHEARRR